ncbi:MAG: hypothetical protein CMM62_19920 [Rhodospirillaceae bacterium]|jgi:hypothetical protein|nr:hypothetical protein [Rhodospirillaceae bacterium]MAX63600.1 hypothetical protein [Rhodospirillaceae bacterium]|tara:strand:+ start:113 stop:1276 length:1164 start_codon:yes stop_codon:yes gene_type:complete
MYRILYAGFDTLDVSFKGALDEKQLSMLRDAQQTAKVTKQDQAVEIGPGPFCGMLKGHGMSGGYAFVLTNGQTGAIYSIKDDSNTREWNIGVSVRALHLLTYGYEATKQWIVETLEAMGCRLLDHSVRRLDYAIDIYAPDFQLELSNFVTPGRSKLRPHWSKEQDLDDDGNRPSGVFSGRAFETITIGKMPNRQVTIYDKRRAVIDMGQPYWFDAWGIDPNETNLGIYRVEVRAGRDALAKGLIKRTFSAVEAYMQGFVSKALSDIRYVTDKDSQLNVSRTTLHPLWQLAQEGSAQMGFDTTPVLHESRALEIIREQRRESSIKQGFGCLMNTAILDGNSPETLGETLEGLTNEYAEQYLRSMGELNVHKKAAEIKARLAPLLCSYK